MKDTQELEAVWLQAMEARDKNLDEEAAQLFHSILKEEPRLAEPRLELAHLEIDRDHLEEAEEQVRMALEILKNGGQWVDDVEPDALLSFAWNMLGEVLFRRGEELAVSPDRERFERIWNEAAAAFTKALELDAENRDALRNATHCRTIKN